MWPSVQNSFQKNGYYHDPTEISTLAMGVDNFLVATSVNKCFSRKSPSVEEEAAPAPFTPGSMIPDLKLPIFLGGSTDNNGVCSVDVIPNPLEEDLMNMECTFKDSKENFFTRYEFWDYHIVVNQEALTNRIK